MKKPLRTITYGLGLLFLTMLFITSGMAQHTKQTYSRQDSLRGSITPEREWWDLVYYHLDIEVKPKQKSIEGSNTIYYKVVKPGKVMQIDLQQPMKIQGFFQNGKELDFKKEGNAYFVTFETHQEVGDLHFLEVAYSGSPRISPNPPWEGGLTWEEDKKGKPFIANSNQGDGASLWWPCKDHMYDEPDSMLISVKVPDPLMNVSNGRLREIEKHNDGKSTYHWFVSNPIANYGVNLSIADYVHFSEMYQGEKGPLSLDYYVLKENLEKAKVQFRDVPRLMRAFEHWFGPYPFYEDGFKLIEVPYLGMEHQSAVTYGNGYSNGYKGKDFSETGWGLTFDYIIIHEAGHEWFANNITYKDIADMWIHESFTTYSESLFLDYHYGVLAGNEYLQGARRIIRNDGPIIGDYGVNQRGSGDMYFKGANILHTLRQWIDNDEKWRGILRKMNKVFYHQTVTTVEIETFLAEESGLDLQAFFDQYLRTEKVPIFQYYWKDNKLYYRWENTIANFAMPLKINQSEKTYWIDPELGWKSTEKLAANVAIEVDPNFYIYTQQIQAIK
ncbi:Peptidase M1 membrane alanine aminopeptidase [Cyclobacterium marinum DSM 745]|uniref:Peptidase M1 membrane alanine aminopeptidase n=2 Tax=Cyclobacterium marinum TaxID=104 RepID=G0IYP6_CYCMS|nr:Peptidase M1 membrane alanine aminopeptidase [Cyclobacterium marinum DSM 745]